MDNDELIKRLDYLSEQLNLILPSILMIIFAILIVSNIRLLRMQIQTVSLAALIIPRRTKQFKMKKNDHQLLRMLLVQVFLLVIFCIPQAIQKFYITFRSSKTYSEYEDAINRFLYNIEVLLAFIASGMPFYLYTLSGGVVFRKALMDLIVMVYKKMKC
ncbi:hypothetical protein I4U23_020234 [Adineta vaga]|nr:hypothetical protein I4U23_020234 [Adineta vaga]